MLGQSKTAYQAEIDSACELIDFWRIYVHFARQILAEQPMLPRASGTARTTGRSRASSTPSHPSTSPRSPATCRRHRRSWATRGLEALAHAAVRGQAHHGAAQGPRACRPASSTSSPVTSSTPPVALSDPDLAGIHFTGSTATFQHLWQEVSGNLPSYRTYPRLVGETGGKDFILAHPSADPDVLRTAMIRGAFEYQGQKCSAASRAYVPRSLWRKIKADLASTTDGLTQGDVTDLSNFMGAVIDEKAFAKHAAAIDRAHSAAGVEVVAGGK